MEFDLLWEGFLRVAPKYARSHYYDIMAYYSGTLALVFTILFKKHFKNVNRRAVYRKFGYDVNTRPMTNVEAGMSYRRRNLIIAVFAFFLGCSFFAMIAYASAKIRLATVWLPIAGLTAIAEYTFLEQFCNGWISRLIEVLIIEVISIANGFYCLNNENHHKECYAIKITVIVFAIAGIIGQFFYRRIDKWSDCGLSPAAERTDIQSVQPGQTENGGEIQKEDQE